MDEDAHSRSGEVPPTESGLATSPRPATAALTAAAAASDAESDDGILAGADAELCCETAPSATLTCDWVLAGGDAGDAGRDEVAGETVDKDAVDGLGPGVAGGAGNRAAEEGGVAGDWTRLPAGVVELERLPSPDEGTGADARGASTGGLAASTVPPEPTDTPGYEGTGPSMASEVDIRSEEISLGALVTVSEAIPFVPRMYGC